MSDINEREFDRLLDSIRDCATFESAEPLLERLGRLQNHLAARAFRDKVKLSSKLMEFVREYDRWDAESVRKGLYQNLRSSKPPFPCRG